MAMEIEETQISLTHHDLSQIDSVCREIDQSHDTLIVAAWLSTLSIYNAASEVAVGLIQSFPDRNGTKISAMSTTVDENSTLNHIASHLRNHEAEALDIASFLQRPPTDFHYNGTVIGFANDEVLKDACAEFIEAFNSMPNGSINACIMVTNSNHISLRCLADSIPSPSPSALLETFVMVLRSFSSKTMNIHINELEVLGPLNRELLKKWSPSQFSKTARCVHDFIDEHARNTPNKEAVAATEGSNLTYAQLSDISTRLAFHLVQIGVKRGDIVPILFDKSSYIILSVIAIMKAGAAWVGFSIETPINFLRECAMIVDAPLVLTSEHRQELVEKIGRKPLVVDGNLVESLRQAPQEFYSPAAPTDVAYLAFTSGSTGTPKAVVTEHQSYVTCALAQINRSLLTTSSRVLQFASCNFDAVNIEIMTVLIAGATICMPSEQGRISDLAGEVSRLKANWMGVTATLARIQDPRDLPSLKAICLWGEANTPDVIAQWSAVPDILNGYGPSEASAIFTFNIYTRQSPKANNIGSALDGVCAGHVVSPVNVGQRLPVGAIGELLIQGPILGRGYFKEPEKTAKAYIQGPSWLPESTPGEFRRMYRTGDLVRQLPDQSFEIFGRIDKQVKINGQRIELGEIEYKVSRVLGEDFKVAVEAVQLPWRAKDAKTLLAFYSRHTGPYRDSVGNLIDTYLHVQDARALIDSLRDDLKAVAIPKAFISLRILPATTQGKLDRKALQTLGSLLDRDSFARFTGEEISGEVVKTASERTVQHLFAACLGINARLIFRDSDFLLMGGDSIRAMKLVSSAQKQGLGLSVPDVLQNSKLSDIANLLEQRLLNDGIDYRPLESIGDPDTAAELMAAVVKATQITSRDEIEDIIESTDYQASCAAWATLQRRGAINWLLFDFAQPQEQEAVKQLCETLAARHAMLRTAFVSHRRSLYLVVLKSFRPPLKAYLHLKSISETSDSLVAEDRKRKVNLAEPQTAFELLAVDGKVQRLMIRLSHAQYDGQSLVILTRDIMSILQEQALDEISGSFCSYQHLARRVEHEPGIAYWRSLLSGATMTKIVRHESQPAFLDTADRAIIKTIPTRLLRAPKPLSKATVIKTAWALVLAEATRTDDIVFGSTVWGRNAAVRFADDMLGSCLSHIPTRAQFLGCHSYTDLMRQLQAQHVASMRFESLGANTVVEQCTAWPRWTRFSSLVLFQGLEIEALGDSEVPTAIKIDEIVEPSDRTDLLLHVEQFGEDTKVILRFCRKNVPESVAQIMVDRFENFLEVVTQTPDKVVKREGQTPTLLPIRLEQRQRKTQVKDPNEIQVKFLRSVVESVWMKVMDLSATGVSECMEAKRLCLEIWGNIVCAATLAHEYKELGFHVSTEDMLCNQTMDEQIMLLSSVSS